MLCQRGGHLYTSRSLDPLGTAWEPLNDTQLKLVRSEQALVQKDEALQRERRERAESKAARQAGEDPFVFENPLVQKRGAGGGAETHGALVVVKKKVHQ